MNPLIQPGEIFSAVCRRYSGNTELINRLWKEIENAYSEPWRHYHTLQHLDRLINELMMVKDEISDWDLVLFSVFYHDFIYNVQEQDNEEKSAAKAGECLEMIGLPTPLIEKCREQILSTATHNSSNDPDTRYFLDADLSILGSEPAEYLAYTDTIRREYAVYPLIIYREGRKNIIRKFLQKERIFQSEYFFDKYEGTARENLRNELNAWTG